MKRIDKAILVTFLVFTFLFGLAEGSAYGQEKKPRLNEYRTIERKFGDLTKSEGLWRKTYEELCGQFIAMSTSVQKDGYCYVSHDKLWEDCKTFINLGYKYGYIEDFQAQIVIYMLESEYKISEPINRDRLIEAIK